MPAKRKIAPTAETLSLFGAARERTDLQSVERPITIPNLRIGTSSFTAAGWSGPFYPPELKPKEYLPYYATKFNTVEVDSTFYATPSTSTVNGWREKTPEGFIFAAKVPQIVTHERVLLDCEREFEEFVDTMRLLGDKLGPLVLQFPYFNAFTSLLLYKMNQLFHRGTATTSVEIYFLSLRTLAGSGPLLLMTSLAMGTNKRAKGSQRSGAGEGHVSVAVKNPPKIKGAQKKAYDLTLRSENGNANSTGGR